MHVSGLLMVEGTSTMDGWESMELEVRTEGEQRMAVLKLPAPGAYEFSIK